MDKLFDTSEYIIPPITREETCRTCEHRQRWKCGSKIIQYCGVRKSNRTFNGLLKIKCNLMACEQYKEEK